VCLVGDELRDGVSRHGLRRRHVELADATVTVAGQVTEVGGRFIAGPPKTSAGLRTVPLPGTPRAETLEQATRRTWLQAAGQHHRGSGRRESNPHRELGKLEFCH
jgi:hypothetical protein